MAQTTTSMSVYLQSHEPSDGVYEGLIGMYEDILPYQDMIHPPGSSVTPPVHPASQTTDSPPTAPPSSPELSPATSPSPSPTPSGTGSERSRRAAGVISRSPPASVSKANDKIAIKNGDIFCKNPRAKLEPLRHVGNGKSVPEFPATLAELRLLKDGDLDSIMKSLRSDRKGIATEVKVEWISRQWVKILSLG